ncbi:hypothetical protein Dsin_019751 [Dipteronia sinensis]|uniref:Uncharacterized protein n=1 Tax=Dipteronia sinensis TaxID=43782 RepID=A0AAE0E308_9ROSI|nr:hypothetical protein Dsin_019751 [Dipteronia sinensis]
MLNQNTTYESKFLKPKFNTKRGASVHQTQIQHQTKSISAPKHKFNNRYSSNPATTFIGKISAPLLAAERGELDLPTGGADPRFHQHVQQIRVSSKLVEEIRVSSTSLSSRRQPSTGGLGGRVGILSEIETIALKQSS